MKSSQITIQQRQRMKRFTRRKLMMKILKKHGHVCNHKAITHSKDM